MRTQPVRLVATREQRRRYMFYAGQGSVFVGVSQYLYSHAMFTLFTEKTFKGIVFTLRQYTVHANFRAWKKLTFYF